MVKKFVKYYYNKTFEEKIEFSSFFSILSNLILAAGKVLITIYTKSIFFLISGIINLCMGLAKKECYLGIKKKDKNSFKKRNTIVSILVMIAGLMYILYMGRLLIFDVKTTQYTMLMGITIATVSFVEMGLAIAGIIKVKWSGNYYRNIKLINLVSASSALVSTQIAILSFTKTTNANFANGLFGVGVGFFTIILGIFILILPTISMNERTHNEYSYLISKEKTINDLKTINSKYKIIINQDNDLKIIFADNKIYGKYYYEAIIENEKIIGDLKHENHFFKELHLVWKIIIITLSEILIFVWIIGKLINFFKNANLPEKLNKIMNTCNTKKII